MAMGHPTRPLDLVLSLARLNRVLEHEPADLTATVQAGITVWLRCRQLGSRRQWWPLDPPLPATQRLGECWRPIAVGLSACCTARRATCSSASPWCTPMAASRKLGEGHQNVTGYDMMKLYIGSLGTLAVIAEATLKLRPVPLNQELIWATFTGQEAAVNTAQRLLADGLQPNAVELVNPPVTAWLRQRLDGPEGHEGWSLIVGIDGAELAVVRQRREIDACSRAGRATTCWTSSDDGRLWQALQHGFRPDGRRGRSVWSSGRYRPHTHRDDPRPAYRAGVTPERSR